MLIEEAEYIGKNIDRKLLNSFSRPLTSSVEFVNVLNNATLVRDARFIIDSLHALDNAVNHIIGCCTVSTDRYELDRGGVSRTLAYREYYRAENAILRSVVSDREYADHVVKFNQLSELKRKIFS